MIRAWLSCAPPAAFHRATNWKDTALRLNSAVRRHGRYSTVSAASAMSHDTKDELLARFAPSIIPPLHGAPGAIASTPPRHPSLQAQGPGRQGCHHRRLPRIHRGTVFRRHGCAAGGSTRTPKQCATTVPRLAQTCRMYSALLVLHRSSKHTAQTSSCTPTSSKPTRPRLVCMPIVTTPLLHAFSGTLVGRSHACSM